MTRINTGDQRARLPIALLDEKLEAIRLGFTDTLHYDRAEHSGALRTRTVAWRLGPSEFLLTYHELAQAPASAIFRLRSRPYQPGANEAEWREIATLGELDAALRQAKKQRAPNPGDLRAQAHADQHDGETPENLILVGVTGSRAYGLNHEGFTHPETGETFKPSDTDTRGVFVLPTRDVLALIKPRVLVEQRETDTCYDEVERFLTLCLKGNPERLEMLAAQKTLVTPEGEQLVAQQRMFLSKQLIKTYGGYAKQQLYRIERKQERHHKPAMHLIRLLITGTRILEEGVVDCDMRDERDRLLAIRFGLMPIEEAFAWHRELEARFARAAEQTKLPDEPDYEAASRLLLAIRRDHLT